MSIQQAVKAANKLGVVVIGLPKQRNKLPKTKLGSLVDEYRDLRDIRLAMGAIAEALKKAENELTNHIIENVDADSAGVVGQRFKAIVVREDKPVVEDWEKLYEHIRKKKAFDLLNKALNASAVKARLEDGKTVPGVGKFQAKKLSVTKI